METTELSLNASLIVRILWVLTFFFVLASVGTQVTAHLSGHHSMFGLVRLFDLDDESNIPTVFTTLLHFFAASLLLLITLVKRRESAIYATHWGILAIGFFYLGFDEGASIHEMFIHPMRTLLQKPNLGLLYYAWVIPAFIVVCIIGVCFKNFLSYLPKKTRFLFVSAGLVFVGGAVGMEAIEGHFHELYGEKNLVNVVLSTIEEWMEMAGIVTFIWALLMYISDHYQNVNIKFIYAKSVARKSEARSFSH